MMDFKIPQLFFLMFFPVGVMASNYRLNCHSCPKQERENIEINISRLNEFVDSAVISKKEGSTITKIAELNVQPGLPEHPEDPFTVYRGQAGTHFRLQIYHPNSKWPKPDCNTLLSWPTLLGEGKAETFSCKFDR